MHRLNLCLIIFLLFVLYVIYVMFNSPPCQCQQPQHSDLEIPH